MTPLAIGIVVLPDTPMIQTIIEMNRALRERHYGYLGFGDNGILPHIPLHIGYITDDLLAQCQSILSVITRGCIALSLRVSTISHMDLPWGDAIVSLHISPDDELSKLYEDVQFYFKDIVTHIGDKEGFVDPEKVDQLSLSMAGSYSWLFHGDATLYPHIDIGLGKIDEYALPIPFTASQIAICQLGEYCTCQRILASAYLPRSRLF